MKRSISILMAVVVGFAFAASAGAAPVPKPSIEDPAADANFVNDQGTGDGTVGDQVLPAGASTFADLRTVTFTNDKNNIYVHIKTESTSPPQLGEGFRVRTNPDGPGGVYCLNFEILFPGSQNTLTAMRAHLVDTCAGGATTEAEAAFSLLGGYMIVVPRSAHEGLGKGAKLTAPQAATFLYSGEYPNGVAGPYLDTTKPGTDYALKK